jgi:TRAP-type C4-dicarboxylate transport system permease small subunit
MKSKIDSIISWTLAILLATMTIDVIWGVFSRYIIGYQSSWTDELARYLMIWVGILGAAYASGKDLHIAIDLLPHYLNNKNKKRLDIFVTSVIVLFVIGGYIIGGLHYVYISFVLGQTSAALKLPMWIVYSVFPISGIITIYYRIRNTFYI